jgi:hypothetical protein
MAEANERVRQAIESLLENESLTDNLDDEAAQTLLDWGITYTRLILGSPLGEAVEEALEEKLRAVRRLLRVVNGRFDPAKREQLAANPQATVATNVQWLEQIVEQVAIIVGADFVKPDVEQLTGFAREALVQAGTPQAMIRALRQWIDQHTSPPGQEEPPVASATATQATLPAQSSEGLVGPMPVFSSDTPDTRVPSTGQEVASPARGCANAEPQFVQPGESKTASLPPVPESWAARLLKWLQFWRSIG